MRPPFRTCHHRSGAGGHGGRAGGAYEFSDDELDEGGELASRPQDFFTWFNLSGRCVACGDLVEIADYECS